MSNLKPVKVFISNSTARILSLALVLMLSIGITIVVPGFSARAQSSDMQSLIDRLNRLERDFNDVQRQFYKGEKPKSLTGSATSSSVSAGDNSDAYAILSERLDQLEAVQRNLTGPLEEANFKLDQMAKRLDKLVIDVDFRLTEIERKVAGGQMTPANSGNLSNAATGVTTSSSDLANPATPLTANQVVVNEGQLAKGTKVLGTISANPQQSEVPTIAAVPPKAEITVAAPSILPPGSPQEQYNFAIGLVRTDQFDAAKSAFNEFLETHKDHALAGNAQYWLGETYYVRGDYPNAASAFLAGYQNYPDNAKVADNLLKLAMSLSRMDQKEEACAAFVQMDQQFTKLPSRVKRMVVREKASAGCK